MNDVIPAGFHQNSVISQVPLSNIQIDRSYQRAPSQSLVDEITANWSEVASELVLISNRGDRQDGGLFLVNGQHRTLAARKLGHETIWARIVDLSEVTDPGAVEADLRLKTNVRLGDRPLERFRAQLRSGDEASLNIVKILARFDTEINEQTDTSIGINCVATIEAVYGADEGALLTETLEVVRDTFGGFSGKGASAAMFKSVAWFVEKHGMESDRFRLCSRLKMAGPEGIHRRAVNQQSIMGGTLWLNYYRTIADYYNEGLQDKSKVQLNTRGASTWKVRGAGNSSPGYQSGH